MAYLPSQNVLEVIRGLFMDPHLVHVAAVTPDPVFRFGASSLLNDVLMQWEKLRTGAYQRPEDFSND